MPADVVERADPVGIDADDDQAVAGKVKAVCGSVERGLNDTDAMIQPSRLSS